MASPGAEVDLTFGVIFVGLIVTGCLFGVTTAQTGWYFIHYPKDRRLLKALVTSVWLLDATNLGLYIATLFTYLVQERALYSAEGEPLPWTSNVQLLCNAFAIGLIQSFYASRIWTLSRHKPLLAIMGLFILVTWAFAIVLFIKTLTTRSVSEYVSLSSLDIAMSVMAASTDVLLCGAMVYLLSTSRTGTQGADRLINKLMLYTVHTGLLTSVFSILSILTVAILPSTSLFIAFYYIGSQMYTVSLLATLNARLSLRMQAAHMGECTLPEIKVTTAQRAPKLSLQTSPVGLRHDSAASVPYLSPAGSSTTGGDSSDSMTPSPIRCEGNRCYVVPEGEFSFAYDFVFGDGQDVAPCSVPEPRDGPDI